MNRLRLASLTSLGMLVGLPCALAAPARPAPRTPARAAAREAPRSAPKRATPTPPATTSVGTVGGYNGVTPGLPKMPRIHLPKNAASRCYLTWSGFQVLPTGSRLFLQFNRKPTFKTTVKATSLRVRLPGCRVANWNNARPLYMRYFPTPLRYSRVRRRRGGLELSALLKGPASPRFRLVTLQGWHYLFISFRHTRAAWMPRSRPPKRPAPGRRPRPGKAPRGPQSP